MKLMHFNDFRLGVLKGDQVVDVTDVVANIPHVGPGDRMNSLIAHFGDFRARLEAAAASGTGVPVASVRIRPPVPKTYERRFETGAGVQAQQGTGMAHVQVAGHQHGLHRLGQVQQAQQVLAGIHLIRLAQVLGFL